MLFWAIGFALARKVLLDMVDKKQQAIVSPAASFFGMAAMITVGTLLNMGREGAGAALIANVIDLVLTIGSGVLLINAPGALAGGIITLLHLGVTGLVIVGAAALGPELEPGQAAGIAVNLLIRIGTLIGMWMAIVSLPPAKKRKSRRGDAELVDELYDRPQERSRRGGRSRRPEEEDDAPLIDDDEEDEDDGRGRRKKRPSVDDSGTTRRARRRRPE